MHFARFWVLKKSHHLDRPRTLIQRTRGPALSIQGLIRHLWRHFLHPIPPKRQSRLRCDLTRTEPAPPLTLSLILLLYHLLASPNPLLRIVKTKEAALMGPRHPYPSLTRCFCVLVAQTLHQPLRSFLIRTNHINISGCGPCQICRIRNFCVSSPCSLLSSPTVPSLAFVFSQYENVALTSTSRRAETHQMIVRYYLSVQALFGLVHKIDVEHGRAAGGIGLKPGYEVCSVSACTLYFSCFAMYRSLLSHYRYFICSTLGILRATASDA